MDAFAHDLRYAARTLMHMRGVAIVAILTLSLGIGATTTMFSVVHALLLRPLPFEDPARLVWIANGESENLSSQTIQVDNLRDFQRQSRALISATGGAPGAASSSALNSRPAAGRMRSA